MIEIPLTKGYVTIIDDIDADLTEFKWTALISKNNVYAIRAIGTSGKPGREYFLMHRVVLARIEGRGLEKRELCDHKNLNTLDNTRSNLRVATTSQNSFNANKCSRNTSGYRGVYLLKPGVWKATITVDGKSYYLGRFPTASEAGEAYMAAVVKYRGEFARQDNE